MNKEILKKNNIPNIMKKIDIIFLAILLIGLLILCSVITIIVFQYNKVIGFSVLGLFIFVIGQYINEIRIYKKYE